MTWALTSLPRIRSFLFSRGTPDKVIPFQILFIAYLSKYGNAKKFVRVELKNVIQ